MFGMIRVGSFKTYMEFAYGVAQRAFSSELVCPHCGTPDCGSHTVRGTCVALSAFGIRKNSLIRISLSVSL